MMTPSISIIIAVNVDINNTDVLATGVIADILVWGLIDDSQTPNYSTISTSQTPNYSTVNTSQTPNWDEVA